MAGTDATRSRPAAAGVEPEPTGDGPPALRRLETVLRHSSDAVVLCDASGRIVDANAAAPSVLGPTASAGDLEGRSLLEVLPDELRDEVTTAWQRLVAGEELATASTTVQGQVVRVHLGAVVHQDRLEGAVAVWRNGPGRRVAPGAAADELRRGIERGELRLHHQPVVELAEARPVGTEALVRWQHPQAGLLAPAAFVDLAERTGLVVELGDWVLATACRTAAAWAERPGLTAAPLQVSVNLSARQLHGDGLLRSVAGVLEDSGCPPDLLVLEVTETAVMADLATAVRTLTALKELGVGLAIDDFGTGYSSLLYLKHFPVDSIKIDRSFVAGLGRNADDTAIVAATVALAHSVDVRCVAEGVETVEHLDLLRDMGCDFAQGFLFAHPMESTALPGWLDLHLRPAGLLAGTDPAPLPPSVAALLTQGASLHTIAAALNAQGSRTERGTRWSARSVAHLIATRRREETPDGA